MRPGGPERAPSSAAAPVSAPQVIHALARPSAVASSPASIVLPTPGGPSRQSTGDGPSGLDTCTVT